jgi:hypothetical protein
MKDSERRSYEMIARVRDFCEARAASFAAGTRGQELFSTLKQVVTELDTHARDQTSRRSAGAEGTTSRATAREALYEDLLAISRTARAMAFDSPGLEERFRLPRGNRNDQNLLSTARAFLADAEPFKAEFISNEMPPDFLQDLEADIAAFGQSITDQNSSAGARVAATTAVDSAIERGVTLVRQLDAIIRNKFRDDPATLAAWTSACHTERAPRTKRPPQPPAPTPSQ